MAMRRTHLDGEPSIPELLVDPIIKAVMDRDKVTAEQLEHLIDAVRHGPARELTRQ